MKIAIDARLYGLENGGIGRYVMNLVNELSKLKTPHEFHILLRSEYMQIVDLPVNWHKHELNVRHYSIREQVELPRMLYKLAPDLTHFPHFNVPIVYNKPFVVTIHDLSKHRSKGTDTTTLPVYTFMIKRTMYYKVVKAAIEKSVQVITPTNIVKDDVLQHYHVNSDKLAVIYEGVTALTSKMHDPKRILEKYKLDKPFFMFTGNAYPHKNLDRLIEATVLLNEQYGVSAMLGISSSRSVFTERLEKIIKKNHARDYIKLLGFVPDEELDALYSASEAFVYPSLMEGFGLPGLEAMQAGTLALVSNIPVFKEIYKDAAIYFNPHDFSAMADCMRNATNMNTDKRKKLVTKGKKHVSQYNWKKMAEETLKVYEDSVSL